MDAKRFEKYVNVLHILNNFKQEQDIIRECFNESVENNNVQVSIGPAYFVNID